MFPRSEDVLEEVLTRSHRGRNPTRNRIVLAMLPSQISEQVRLLINFSTTDLAYASVSMPFLLP